MRILYAGLGAVAAFVAICALAAEAWAPGTVLAAVAVVFFLAAHRMPKVDL